MATRTTRAPVATETLVRRLVAQTSVLAPRSPTLDPFPPPDSKVLFSCEIDGVRCLLVKDEPRNHHVAGLSPREQEIVRMVAKGYPNKAIAGVLEISVWTVGTHLRRIFIKLGVTSRAAMIARIFEQEGPRQSASMVRPT